MARQMKIIPSKLDCIKEAKEYGIDFAKDVFELSISDKSFMAELAKRAGYRKSRTSTLSRGSAFFVHLVKFRKSQSDFFNG